MTPLQPKFTITNRMTAAITRIERTRGFLEADMGIDKALEEISQNKGILYDPEVADVCLRLFKEKGFKFQ